MCFFAAPAAAGGAAAAASAAATSATMMAISTAMAAAGTAVSVAGSVQQGKYQSDIMKRNAKLAEVRAEDALKRGREEETRLRRQILLAAGREEARQGGSGTEATSPTNVSLLEDLYWAGELDAQIIRENAAREAWGHRATAGGYQAQAGMFEQAGGYNVGSSLLAGGTELADRWYQYRRPARPAYERTSGGIV